MNINQFDKTKFGIEGTGVDTITTTERKWTDKHTQRVSFSIPAGTRVHVDFSPKLHSSNIFITIGDEVKISQVVNAHNWLRGFRKCPSINTLQKQDSNGIVSTVTGKRVEPDGFSYDGSPSWMLVIGII